MRKGRRGLNRDLRPYSAGGKAAALTLTPILSSTSSSAGAPLLAMLPRYCSSTGPLAKIPPGTCGAQRSVMTPCHPLSQLAPPSPLASTHYNHVYTPRMYTSAPESHAAPPRPSSRRRPVGATQPPTGRGARFCVKSRHKNVHTAAARSVQRPGRSSERVASSPWTARAELRDGGRRGALRNPGSLANIFDQLYICADLFGHDSFKFAMI